MKNLFKITLAIITTVILISCGNLVESTSSGVTGGGANGGGNTYSNEDYSNYQSGELIGRWIIEDIYYRTNNPFSNHVNNDDVEILYGLEFTPDGKIFTFSQTEEGLKVSSELKYEVGYNKHLELNYFKFRNPFTAETITQYYRIRYNDYLHFLDRRGRTIIRYHREGMLDIRR